jgi:hypothetical protein
MPLADYKAAMKRSFDRMRKDAMEMAKQPVGKKRRGQEAEAATTATTAAAASSTDTKAAASTKSEVAASSELLTKVAAVPPVKLGTAKADWLDWKGVQQGPETLSGPVKGCGTEDVQTCVDKCSPYLSCLARGGTDKLGNELKPCVDSCLSE